MRELLPDLENWMKAGESVALATVISTWGSAPRGPGSLMAVNEHGGMVGSVSGGCVEGAVIQAAQEVLKSGKSHRLNFGVADETAWDVGLACGGEIDIFVQPFSADIFAKLLPRLKANQTSYLISEIQGPSSSQAASQLVDQNGAAITGEDFHISASLMRKPQIVTRSDESFFINPLLPPPSLIMVGGVHIAVALSRLAKELEFQTVVIDPRRAFGSQQRFADVDQLIQAWPQKAFEQISLSASCAVSSLSHDPKIDDPALLTALRSDAFYVGALGSKKTQAKRRQRLLAAGLPKGKLDKLHAPIGLDIGAETPEEIALAILAQIVQAFRS